MESTSSIKPDYYQQTNESSDIEYNTALTSAEIAELWTTYMHYTMLCCIFAFFKAQAKDIAVKDLMEEAFGRCQKRVDIVSNLLRDDNQPIPIGFSAKDVNVNAPALYADNYLLHYLQHMLRVSFTINSLNLNLATRPDVRDFYIDCLESSLRLRIMVDDQVLARGIALLPPVSTISKEVEFIHNPGFLTGFLGKKRPLLAMEVTHLYFNCLSNQIARILLLGFRQVSSNQEVRDFFTKGIHYTDKYIDELSAFAENEDIYFTFPSDGDVTTSVESPFSDHLMMFHINALGFTGIGMYAVSMGASPRHDLAATYAKMIIESGQYAEKGAKLSMEKGWLEEPPQILNRDKLAEMKN